MGGLVMVMDRLWLGLDLISLPVSPQMWSKVMSYDDEFNGMDEGRTVAHNQYVYTELNKQKSRYTQCISHTLACWSRDSVPQWTNKQRPIPINSHKPLTYQN